MKLKKEQHSPEENKTQLWRIFILSAVIDIITTTGVLATFGLGVVIEEIIENLISQLIANYGGLKLSKIDNIAGALPIPGVTAVTIHCGRKLYSIYNAEKIEGSL